MGWKHEEAVFLGTFWGEILGACLTNTFVVWWFGKLHHCLVVCLSFLSKCSAIECEAVQHLLIICNDVLTCGVT